MGKKENCVYPSQCMIVKNEEKDIERALSWGKGIVFEQIVVDTGSTDRTVEIAEAMGAKVYHFPWIDDFSAAKNFAIEKAVGDWIAFLDADEYFLPEDAKKLLPLLEQVHDSYYAISTALVNIRENGEVLSTAIQARLFRRIPEIRYKNRIHEVLYKKDEAVFQMGNATKALTIFHTGYDNQIEKNRGKGERNAKFLLMELKEHPDDYDWMGYLGDCYARVEDKKSRAEAVKWYDQAVERMPKTARDQDGRSAETCRRLMELLFDGEERELLRIYEIAGKMLPKESDFDYIMGRFYMERENYEKAAFHFETALQLVETYGNVGRSHLTVGNLTKVWYWTALCYFNQGNLQKCLGYCTPLLKEEPYSLAAMVLFFQAMERGEQNHQVTTEQVLELLDKMYDRTQAKARVFLLMAAEKAGYHTLEKHLEIGLRPEEITLARRK